jgi:excisionase family DNA binding protein
MVRSKPKTDAAQTSGTLPTLAPRGLRIQQAADYSGLSPFHIEELIRNGTLPAVGGPGSGVCVAYVVLREHLDDYLTELGEAAVERAEQRRKSAKAA